MKLPAPHLVLHDFLPQEQLDLLMSWTAENASRYEPRVLAGTLEDPDRWLCLKLNDLGPMAPILHARIKQEYSAWTRQLRLSAFQLDQVELRMAAYKDKGSFAYHLDSTLDQSRAEHTRALTGVYYYHRLPRRFEGGSIRLFDLGANPESGQFRELAPTHNALLLFPSWVGHQVMPIHCDSNDFMDLRFSINLWLHRRPLSSQRPESD